MIPLLIDRAIPSCDKLPLSLLQLPVGSSMIIERIVGDLPIHAEDEILVLPPTSMHPTYENLRIDWPKRILRSKRELHDVIGRLPPTDRICLIDAGFQAAGSIPLRSIARQYRNYRGVVAVIGKEAAAERIHERVIANQTGEIIEIQRIYPQSNGPARETVRPLALMIPTGLCAGIRHTSIEEALASLKRAGELCFDVFVDEAVFDLNTQAGLLGFHEKCSETTARTVRFERKGLKGSSKLAPNCTVSPTANISGRVFIHEGAVIEEHAMLIGPVTIGPRVRVGRSAVVTDSIVIPCGAVAPEEVVTHEIVSRPGSAGTRQNRNKKNFDGSRSNLNSFAHAEDANVTHPTITPTLYDIAKRATDLLLSAMSLVLLLPVLAMIAVLLRMDSPGPVLFTHRREGRGGRDFPCYKFRTMTVGAHHRQRELSANNQLDGPQFKINADPRVTAVGRILRITNLDELPQLINVFLGHMSLVGPRPSPFRENQICVPWRRARLSVRPGITGLWQLCRDRSQSSDFHQWIYYDLTYVRRRSTLVDWKILALTILTLGGQRTVPMNWLLPEPQADSTSLSFGLHTSVSN